MALKFRRRERREKRAVSMRAPLFVLFLLMGGIPMLLQGMVMGRSFRQTQIEGRVIEVQNQSLIASDRLMRAEYMSSPGRDVLLDKELDTIADIFNGRIVVVDRNFRIIKDTFKLSEGKIHVSEPVLRCFKGENSILREDEKQYFAVTAPIYDNAEDRNIIGVLLTIASTENILSNVTSVEEKSRFFEIVAFFVLVLTGFITAVLLVRPFERLQASLDRLADGNVEERIAVNTYRETSRISEAITKTMTKLRTMDQSREEFVANVSHELKTPITSIRVLADSLMSMEEAPAELYREFMADISDEIDRENKIIDDLLSMVKMDRSASELNVANADINALVQLILKRLLPLAEKRNVELIFESIREVTADVDETKLSLAISNLVENAIKYNVDGGWVRVTLDADHKYFYIKVADSGIGIPEEFRDSVFERFYRVDKARSRETGGTGLGLSITKKVVLMHGGAIRLLSREGEGSTFTVRIPLTYIHDAGAK